MNFQVSSRMIGTFLLCCWHNWIFFTGKTCFYSPVVYTCINKSSIFKAKFIRINGIYHNWLGYSLTEVTLDLISPIKAKFSAPVLNPLPVYWEDLLRTGSSTVVHWGVPQTSRSSSFDHSWPEQWTRCPNSLVPCHVLSQTAFLMCFHSHVSLRFWLQHWILKISSFPSDVWGKFPVFSALFVWLMFQLQYKVETCKRLNVNWTHTDKLP